jgi:hypothetical protein
MPRLVAFSAEMTAAGVPASGSGLAAILSVGARLGVALSSACGEGLADPLEAGEAGTVSTAGGVAVKGVPTTVFGFAPRQAPQANKTIKPRVIASLRTGA